MVERTMLRFLRTDEAINEPPASVVRSGVELSMWCRRAYPLRLFCCRACEEGCAAGIRWPGVAFHHTARSENVLGTLARVGVDQGSEPHGTTLSGNALNLEQIEEG